MTTTIPHTNTINTNTSSKPQTTQRVETVMAGTVAALQQQQYGLETRHVSGSRSPYVFFFFSIFMPYTYLIF
jgi:hypothetical protein